MKTIRVMIIDEQPLFRKGMHATLEQMEDCEIVGMSTDTANVFKIAHTCNPNVALIDADLISSDPFELVRQICHVTPRLATILLTSSENVDGLCQAIEVGAVAYCSRYITAEELTEIVRKVSHGEYLIRADVLSKPQLTSRIPRSSHGLAIEEEETNHMEDMYSPLSSREIEILTWIARGNTNKEIAEALKISHQTVKNHITSILKKLSLNDRTAAVIHALRHDWIKLHNE